MTGLSPQTNRQSRPRSSISADLTDWRSRLWSAARRSLASRTATSNCSLVSGFPTAHQQANSQCQCRYWIYTAEQGWQRDNVGRPVCIATLLGHMEGISPLLLRDGYKIAYLIHNILDLQRQSDSSHSSNYLFHFKRHNEFVQQHQSIVLSALVFKSCTATAQRVT